MDTLTIILVAVPTTIALYYTLKPKQPNEITITVTLDEEQLPDNTTATQDEWEFKQYHKN